jgi:hypothetical protein
MAYGEYLFAVHKQWSRVALRQGWRAELFCPSPVPSEQPFQVPTSVFCITISLISILVCAARHSNDFDAAWLTGRRVLTANDEAAESYCAAKRAIQRVESLSAYRGLR